METTKRMTRYAIVPSRGCYGSGSTVRPIAVMGSRSAALRRAEADTRTYRREMARYGGSSGGYRVVETDARTRDGVSWLGHDLDRVPSVES